MKQRRAIGFGIVLLLALTAGMYLTAEFDRFDSAKWKAEFGISSLKNPRSGMIGAVEKELRPGMTRTEVEILLGEPEAKDGDNRYLYGIGFGVDYDQFVIEFDDAGKLERYFIRQG